MTEKKIKIKLIDGKELIALYGKSVQELLPDINNKDEYIAAKVNNEVTSLSFRIRINCTLEFLSKRNFHGMEVYRRSLSFLLEKAVVKLFPKRRLVIGHSIGPGYYFDIEGTQLTPDEIKLIEKEMKKEVLENKPIIREKISYSDALNHFKKNGREDKYKLLSTLNMGKLSIYRCDDFFQIFDMPLTCSTGVLNTFSLIPYPPGLILQFPTKILPEKVADFKEQKKIFNVYKENRKLGRILEVDNVGSLNQIILNKQIISFIQVNEALQSKKIINIANEVNKRGKNISLLCIAGPSSSGKTTFSKRLAIQLRAIGLNPVTISVDNYFLEREKTPLDENGNPDYESIDALDIDLFNNNLDKLLKGKTINIPYFDFITGKSIITDRTLTLKKDEIIIIEGIHCLNPKLTRMIPKEKKFKIYVSVLTQMNIDNNNRIPTSDNRVIRRMVRDYKYRGHDAKKTLHMWKSVRRGEEKYIFPFQEDADAYFNSALDYELSVLKPYAEGILMQVKPYDEEYSMAIRLQRFLKYFLPVTTKDIPSTSILREFIGGSSFRKH